MTQQITNKPIPRDAGQWQREVDGWRRFISKIEARKATEGQAWVEAMTKYGRTRLQDLLNHDPRPAKVKARRKR